MGISGLLPLLRSIQTQKHLSDLAGKTLAVDAYVWLHKGAYGCATELVTGKPTTRYVDYAMHRIRLMRHHGIEPYIVFDGGPLPAKQGTEVERRKRREESQAKARQLASQGRHAEARELYTKCVDVSPQHAYQLIKALRAESVQYVVAPYEADAQLAYLERSGMVDGILTEDSDLLVFGCQNVYFKLDATTYTLTHISRSQFSQVKDINLTLWTDKEFRHMAMLSGCDYLEGLKGVGVRTANKLLRKYKGLERTLKSIALENGAVKIPKGYLETFLLAELAFLFQRVYDPVTKQLVHLGGQLPEDWTDAKDQYVGLDIPADLAQLIATGDICPVSREPIKDINPGFKPQAKKSTKSSGTSPRKSLVKQGPMDRFMAPKATPAIKSKENHPIVDSSASPNIPVRKTTGSGRRSLSGEMEKQQTNKIKRMEETSYVSVVNKTTASTSRFFGTTKTKPQSADAPPQGRSETSTRVLEEENGTDVSNVSTGTLVVQVDDEEYLEIEFELDNVEQEEGYRSLSPSSDDIRVSSQGFVPSPEYGKRTSGYLEPIVSNEEDGWGDVEDIFSSPITAKVATRSVLAMRLSPPPTKSRSLAEISGYPPQPKKPTTLLVQTTPSPTKPEGVPEENPALVVDLGALFSSFDDNVASSENSQEGSSGVFDTDHSLKKRKGVDSQGQFVNSPLEDYAPESDFDAVAESELEDGGASEDQWEAEETKRLHAVAQGWKARFSLGTSYVRKERTVIRRETQLSPIAQRRRTEQVKSSKLLPERSVEPLRPIALNLDGGSRSPSPSEKRTSVQKRIPRKSEPLLRNRKSLSERFDSVDELQEDAERWHKRRRISFPVKEDYAGCTDSHIPIKGTLKQPEESTISEVIEPSRNRLDMYRFGG